MRTTLHTDNAAPCWKCDGTIASYTVDDSVSLIDVLCVCCKHRDVFRPPTLFSATEVSPAQVSAAHRAI